MAGGGPRVRSRDGPAWALAAASNSSISTALAFGFLPGSGLRDFACVIETKAFTVQVTSLEDFDASVLSVAGVGRADYPTSA